MRGLSPREQTHALCAPIRYVAFSWPSSYFPRFWWGNVVMVGRTPWSAAGPLAGLFVWVRIFLRPKSGSRGTRADQGVRPTLIGADAARRSKRLLDDRLRLLFNTPQVLLSAKTFGVNLIDIFRA